MISEDQIKKYCTAARSAATSIETLLQSQLKELISSSDQKDLHKAIRGLRRLANKAPRLLAEKEEKNQKLRESQRLKREKEATALLKTEWQCQSVLDKTAFIAGMNVDGTAGRAYLVELVSSDTQMIKKSFDARYSLSVGELARRASTSWPMDHIEFIRKAQSIHGQLKQDPEIVDIASKIELLLNN